MRPARRSAGDAGFVISQGRPLLGAAPQFGNRPYLFRRVNIVGGGSFTNDPYGMFAPRRNEEPGADNHGGLSLRGRAIANPQAGF